MALPPDLVSLLGYLRETGTTTVEILATISYRKNNEILRDLNELKRRNEIRSFEAPDDKGQMITYWEAVTY